MNRYVCIHGHFYQPPRENPWLEVIELQDSAHPFHDWNERISAECYAPNAFARILGGDGKIDAIVNNYTDISFNFGPTLLSWMESQAPEVYAAIIEADKEAQRRYSGHGSAMAQAFNHAILPLSNRRDKYTQVYWGIRDFERRFGRKPEGMWLPETAVDLESLDIMAQMGIKFTVLSQRQAKSVRKVRGRVWRDVSGGKIDPRMPYIQRLNSGRKIAIFFYDDAASRAVAFEGLLFNGEHFAKRLMSCFAEKFERPQIVHIATDGESYGHHHKKGEMALAYAIKHIRDDEHVQFTNYGEYLERHPPNWEVQIWENSSWSCVHGVGRWKENCGCNSGGYSDWDQNWRAPLRHALDWLRDELIPLYENAARSLIGDPWKARNDYIEVVLDRSPDSVNAFFSRHAKKPLDDAARVRAAKLLELQRNAMLMYTSCGWFFDELSGIETVQVIQYAGRVIQLAGELFQRDFEEPFLQRLEHAKSNIPQHVNGRVIYEKFVKPAFVDLPRVGAHFIITKLFDEVPTDGTIYCFDVKSIDLQTRSAGRAKLAAGRSQFANRITLERDDLTFTAIYLGHHNISAGVREFQNDETYATTLASVISAFERADFPEVIQQLTKNFGTSTYTLKTIFRDEQRKLLNEILAQTLENAERVYRQLYLDELPLLKYLADLGAPAPEPLRMAAQFVLDFDIQRLLKADELDLEQIRSQVETAKSENLSLRSEDHARALADSLERLMRRYSESPENLQALREMNRTADVIGIVGFDFDLARVQDMFWKVRKEMLPDMRQRGEEGDVEAAEWVVQFRELGEKLKVSVN